MRRRVRLVSQFVLVVTLVLIGVVLLASVLLDRPRQNTPPGALRSAAKPASARNAASAAPETRATP